MKINNKYPTIINLEILEEIKEKLNNCYKPDNNKYTNLSWTNGCFDLFHIGHIRYLEAASKYSNILIVGVNSDKSIKESKGKGRPVICENDRIELLSHLKFVDYVILFDDKTPIEILKKIKPKYYIKGGDYTIDTINQEERKLVENYGGKIELINVDTKESTSNIIKRIKENC